MMAWAKATQILYWSWSVLSKYRGCPAKAKFSAVDKMKEPGNAAMDRGNDIHKEGEAFLLGAVKALPKSFILFTDKMKALKKAGAKPERSYAWTKDWEPCRGDDFQRAWLRVRIDAELWNAKTKLLYIVDYKTGKDHSESDDNKDQLRLYRLAALLTYPDAKVIQSELWYLDAGTKAGESYWVTDKSLAEEKKYWVKETTRMLLDKRFSPTPSAACRWCWFRKNNTDFPGGSGPCKYSST